MKRMIILVTLLFAFLLIGCNERTPQITSTPVSDQPQTSVSAVPSKPLVSAVPTEPPIINCESASLKTGETIQLTVSNTKDVTWTSSDLYVAMVDDNGLVTGRHKGGTATISGQANGEVYTCAIINTVNVRDITAKQVVSEMNIGTNYASALDVIDWDFKKGYVANMNGALSKLYTYQDKCGAIRPTTDMIRVFKEAGYDSIRLNISWSLYTDDQTFRIDDDFLDIVEEYVNTILDNGMYCIINSHYDYLNYSWVGDKWVGDWMKPEYKSYVDARFKAIWKQVAEHFASYNEQLIFEPMNEPSMNYEDYMKSTGSDKDFQQLQRDRVNEMNKIFYDTVRNSGGNNKNRILAMSPVMNDAYELQYLDIPEDSKLIAEVHYYYNNDDGSPVTEWRSSNKENTKKIDQEFKLIKQDIDQVGIPVILGEWGNTAAMPIEDRIDMSTYIIKQAHNLNVPAFWWECAWRESDGVNENFPLFNRYTMKCAYPDLLKAIMECVKPSNE